MKGVSDNYSPRNIGFRFSGLKLDLKKGGPRVQISSTKKSICSRNVFI